MKLIDEKVIYNCITKQQQISIERADIDDDLISAIPIKKSDNLLLVEYLYDFIYDGFKILLIDKISSIRRGEIEIFHDEILRNERVRIHSDYVNDILIDSWYDFFSSIMTSEYVIDISSETSDDLFFVGRIELVKEKYVELIEINPLGEWSAETTIIYYDNITMVSFQNRYSLMLGKYAKSDN